MRAAFNAAMGLRRMRAEKKFCCRIRLIWVVQSPLAKIFRFPFDPNHFYLSRHPGPHKGAFRDRHERRAEDAMDAGGAADESVILRTAKSCGPDASMVGVKRRGRKLPRGDGDNKA